MVKRIILTSLICFLAASSFGAYFYFVGELSSSQRGKNACSKVEVVVLDSLESSAVNRQEIVSLVEKLALGKITDSVDLKFIEDSILVNGEVLSAQVFRLSHNSIGANLTQRKPVIRFKNESESYYSDPSGFLFPVKHHIEMPLVSGKFPLSYGKSFKGYPSDSDIEWITSMIELSRQIEGNAFLKEHIQQIYLEKNGDIMLYPDSGKHVFIFGRCEDIEDKLKKIEKFYTYIAPLKEEGEYSQVNLKYKNQIVCR